MMALQIERAAHRNARYRVVTLNYKLLGASGEDIALSLLRSIHNTSSPAASDRVLKHVTVRVRAQSGVRVRVRRASTGNCVQQYRARYQVPGKSTW